MRDLQAIAKECISELDAIDIEYGNIKEFIVNTRAVKRWGQCEKVSGGFSINISYILLDDRNDISGLKSTIVHEILHTCKGCMNHGELWKRQAARVNRAYGYGIKRCSSSEELGIEVDNRIKKINYSFKCIGCGMVINRTRQSRFVKHYNSYKCGKCGNHFMQLV